MPKKNARRWYKNPAIIAPIIGIIGIIIGAMIETIIGPIVVPYLQGKLFTPTPIPSIEISYPPPCGMVEIKETVRGTSQNIPEEQVIWVVIYPYEVSRYYPAACPADVQLNGEWSSSVSIGTEAEVGEMFDIIAVLADKKAIDAFNDYLEECKEKESWPGLERLHEDTVICDRITVIRK
jgi:hypothetical protein